jgi:hypothetical protein
MNAIKRLTKQPVTIALVVWFSFVWSWSFFTDTLSLAGSRKQGYILTVFVVLMNVAISVWVVKKGLRIIKYADNKYRPLLFIPLCLCLFALLDYLVAWLVALVWIGPQGSIDSVLPIGSLALPLISTPLRYASRFVGFYGLAAFVWTTIYMLCSTKYRRYCYIPASVLVVTSLVGWYLYRTPNGSTVNVKIISEKLTERVPSIDPVGADLVIFPEYGLEKITNKNIEERIKKTAISQPRTYFLGSDQVYKPEIIGHKNNMQFGDTNNGLTASQEKYRLIPGGEDLSYIVRILLRATNQKDTLDYFSYAKGVLKGPGQLKPFVTDDNTRIAAAVCSSVIAPQDYRDFTRDGATIFTNSASLTTFKGSPLFAWQQKSFARFMATANARYFLQSANSASAYALDSNGNQIAEVKGVETIDVSARNNMQITPYVRVGEWLVWAGVLALVYLAIDSRKGRHILNKIVRKVE